MDDVWPWLASLLRPTRDAKASFPLAASPDGACIVLQAGVVAAPREDDDDGSNNPARVAFSLVITSGANGVARALWTSEAVASRVALRIQLLVQLLDGAIALVPCDLLADDHQASELLKLDAEVVSGVVAPAGGTDDVSSAFFSLALLLRLFWCCALDAAADSGFLFFRLLGPEIEHALGSCRPALGAFLRAVGPDVEERFMRSLGYMLAKWCLLREIQDETAESTTPSSELENRPPPPRLIPAACVSYAAEAHGLWVLRGYAPVLAMPRVVAAAPEDDPALRYGLAHTQLEAVAQLEYAVRAGAGFLAVSVRVDNVRLRVARLGFRGADAERDQDVVTMDGERHFPSRIRVWVGPRCGAAYATGPSLGRSTGNPDRHVETTRVVKGAFAATKLAGSAPRVKAKVRSSARTRHRSWRWEQDAEGGTAVFEGVLCDTVTGTELSSWRPAGNGGPDPRNGMRRRYSGPGRAFSKMRGIVVAGDELPEEVTWRMGREAGGRTLPWRIGLKVWITYLPNEVRSLHFETRCVHWAHEVELPLLPGNVGHQS